MGTSEYLLRVFSVFKESSQLFYEYSNKIAYKYLLTMLSPESFYDCLELRQSSIACTEVGGEKEKEEEKAAA